MEIGSGERGVKRERVKGETKQKSKKRGNKKGEKNNERRLEENEKRVMG